LTAQIGKHAANQPRPLEVLPGIDDHGYPIQPHGNAFPFAHTAVVGLVAGLWPWMHWPQRIFGLTGAGLVATNRLYIGAHWPIDVLGSAAIGLFAASIAWLIAAAWPIR
jgi:membrane-associated phospholipid phosphatase